MRPHKEGAGSLLTESVGSSERLFGEHGDELQTGGQVPGITPKVYPPHRGLTSEDNGDGTWNAQHPHPLGKARGHATCRRGPERL